VALSITILISACGSNAGAATSTATSGATTNMRSTSIRGNVASAGGYVECVDKTWTYTGSFATGGTVTITGLNNTRAVITTTATDYTVAITSGGTTTNCTVGRAQLLLKLKGNGSHNELHNKLS
jgi:ABC-type Fe3+-hydroxamate transport system substrate-binding protein